VYSFLVMSHDEWGAQAWKTFEWATMDRLHEKGWISQPKSKAASVRVTPEGVRKPRSCFGSTSRSDVCPIHSNIKL